MKKRKPAAAKKRRTTSKVSHPGMMGDGTEEQSLGERGNPAARLRKKEVIAAFGRKKRKSTAAKKRRTTSRVSHPGMMGDGTEEQNLGERGNPVARIKKKEVVAAFGRKKS